MIFRESIGLISDSESKHSVNFQRYSSSLLSNFRFEERLIPSFVFVTFLLGLSLTMIASVYYSDGYSFISQAYAVRASESTDGPTINDPNLISEVVYQGLKSPTAMAFLGPDDILVLEKDEGTVQRIVNGEILPEPLLQVDVNSKDERGLLGIAISSEDSEDVTTGIKEDEMNMESEFSSSISSSFSASPSDPPSSITPRYVFLFYTEAGESNGEFPAGNRVYKYELTNDNTRLVNPTLLLDLPAWPDDSHVGGVIDIGPDGNLYLTLGDQRPTAYNRMDVPDSQTKAQNYIEGQEPDGRAGILRITQDGDAVGDSGIFGKEHPLDKYYAYGVKNSFGFDFDPVTGNLWDTENGPTFGDEINLVEPGFNSGWAFIQGFWTLNDEHEKVEEVISSSASEDEDENMDFGLVDLGIGKGKYSHPEFVWDVAPTALTFLNSDKLGQQYENDMFVGDIKNGNLYHFKLDEQRTGLLLDGPLADKIGSKDEIQQAVFASGFGGITDIEVGPDGYLYVLTFEDENGTIYRIGPNTNV